MRKIKLTQDKFAIIDDNDYEWLSKYSWHFILDKGMSGYACTSIEGRTTYMHRLIMKTPNAMDTDHINGDKLDNRRSNLRIATRSQNNGNMQISSHNTSGFKGVSFYKRHKYWTAQIHIKNKKKHLGCFDTALLAAQAYNNAAIEYFGKFAKLNEV